MAQTSSTGRNYRRERSGYHPSAVEQVRTVSRGATAGVIGGFDGDRFNCAVESYQLPWRKPPQRTMKVSEQRGLSCELPWPRAPQRIMKTVVSRPHPVARASRPCSKKTGETRVPLKERSDGEPTVFMGICFRGDFRLPSKTNWYRTAVDAAFLGQDRMSSQLPAFALGSLSN
jgi:hypothetical protein